MFNLFKRTHVFDWEIELILRIATQSSVLSYLVPQIKDFIIAGVRIYNDERNYVGFRFNRNILQKYEDKNMPGDCIKGAKVFDRLSQKYIDFHIYTGYGLVLGYATPGCKKLAPDIAKLDLSRMEQQANENSDFEAIKHLLTNTEIEAINSSEVYAVNLGDTLYYHLMDMEDGDFIGIDTNKNIFKISHDPFEITKLDNNLVALLTAGHSKWHKWL